MHYPENSDFRFSRLRRHLKYSSKINRICYENRTYFLFSYKHQKIPSGVQIKKSFDVSVTVTYSFHLPRGLLVELQWHVNENKIVVGFLKITFYALRKVTSSLAEKVCFSFIALKSLKSALFGILRTRLELKAWSPYES